MPSRNVYGVTADDSADIWRKGSNNRWERERAHHQAALCDSGAAEQGGARGTDGVSPARDPAEQRDARDTAEQDRPHAGGGNKRKAAGLRAEADELDEMEHAMLHGGGTKTTKAARPKKKAATSSDASGDDDDDEEEEEEGDASGDDDDASSAPAPKTKAVASSKLAMKAMKVGKGTAPPKASCAKDKKKKHKKSNKEARDAASEDASTKTKKGKGKHKKAENDDASGEPSKDKKKKKKADDAAVTGVDISDICDKVKASRKTTTRNCAHSRIYKPAITRAVAAGFSHASAKLWASESCTAFLARYNFKKN